MNICERVEVEYKKKVMISSLFPAIFWIISVCQGKYRKKKKKKEKEKKNMERTQTKLTVPHLRYNVKMLPH